MPGIKNFRERRLLKDIFEMRDQADLSTYTYTYSEVTGKFSFFCNSIGYGLPYGVPGALLSGWPAVAFVGCAEMAIGMVRRVARGTREAVPAGVPVAGKESVREIRAKHRVSQATAVKMRNYADTRVRATQNGSGSHD